MMKLIGIIVCFSWIIMFQSSCTNKSNTKDDLSSMMDLLKTNKQQTAFLEAIKDLDQNVRSEESEVIRIYGDSSPEHKESWRLINEADVSNLEKIELYLKTYGHPTLEKHSKKACETPWLVIHHSSEYDPRVRNFHFIYEAYRKGDVRGGALTFYMGRMHTYLYNELYSWDRPYTEDEEVDTLIKRLGLIDISSKIDLLYD